MREVLLKTKYPDGKQLEVVHEDDLYLWMVDEIMHNDVKSIILEKTGKCGWATRIINNLNKKDNTEVLIAGIGFGHTIQTLKRTTDIKVDTVEINEDVVNFYKKNYKDEPVADNIYTDDFKNYITNSDKKYDAIFMQLDFYGAELDKDYPLYSLCVDSNIDMYSEEFFKKIYNRLKPNGYFLIDCFCTKGDTKISDMLKNIGYSVSTLITGPDRKPANIEGEWYDVINNLTIDARKK